MGLQGGGNYAPLVWEHGPLALQLTSWPMSKSRPVQSQAFLVCPQKQTEGNPTQNISIRTCFVPLIDVNSAFDVSDPEYL